jgi:limonene-1,2-epoxide hydrolase
MRARFYDATMRARLLVRQVLYGAGLICVAASMIGAVPARRLVKADVLPLAIEDGFEFRKTELYLNEPLFYRGGSNPVANFQRQRVNFKAVTASDRQERRGNYFTFFWRTKRAADVTIRLEYRQQNLGNHVMAQERDYENVKGSQKSQFQVTGDEYLQDGRVTAWRALMIENGRVVALTQSYLWN